MMENQFNYSTLLGSPKWNSFEYAPSVEYALTQNLDFVGGVTLSYTLQTDDYNTFEVRPMLGSRLHLTPNRRVLLRTYLRVEQRNFKNLETNEWDKTMRPRLRLESLIPINRKTYFENKLWYGIADVEWFMTVDKDVNERYANRFRMRFGAGYRMNYNFRFEFIYMIQQARDKTEEDFVNTDNVFRFRCKHYLRKTKPTKHSGSGN
jgi:hypothetical protein